MNLRDFKYLASVADLKSFRKAADQCAVTQPTLSMQIKKLEEFLGVRLIERNNREIILTEAGNEIVEKARIILRNAEEIKQIANNYKNPMAGEIKLGAFPTLAPYYFPKIVPVISKEFPQLNIFLIEEKTERLLEMLRSGEIDAAFIALPVKDKIFTVKKIFSENFLLAAPKSLSWGKVKYNRDKVSLNDLRDQKLLLLEEGHCLREQALEVCKIAGAGENRSFRATSLETLRNMVASGMGLTLIPELARNENDGINYIPFESHDKAVREIALIWRKGSSRNFVFDKMAEVIGELTVTE